MVVDRFSSGGWAAKKTDTRVEARDTPNFVIDEGLQVHFDSLGERLDSPELNR
ncbi:hypothetical protein D3C85_1910740 [compost metagenome]